MIDLKLKVMTKVTRKTEQDSNKHYGFKNDCLGGRKSLGYLEITL